MVKKTKKTIEFTDEDKYLQIAAAAKLEKQNIGDFLFFLFEHWKKTKK